LEAADSVTEERARQAGVAGSVCRFYPSLHLNLGDVYQRLGDRGRAHEHLERGQAAAEVLGDDDYAKMLKEGLARLAQRAHPVGRLRRDRGLCGFPIVEGMDRRGSSKAALDLGDGPLAEFVALREEMQERFKAQQMLLSLQLTLVATIFGFAISQRGIAALLLIVPFSSYLLCGRQVAQHFAGQRIAQYITDELTPRVHGGLGWEQHHLSTRTDGFGPAHIAIRLSQPSTDP
jgi:hypothetical protein